MNEVTSNDHVCILRTGKLFEHDIAATALTENDIPFYKQVKKGGWMNRPFVDENTKERERLISLVSRVTDEELSLPLGDGWTIAVALAHLAFWDQRCLFLLRKWKKTGVVEPSPIDIDVTNDSLLLIWLALPPRAASALQFHPPKKLIVN